MKGTITKLDNQWMVRYIQEDPRDPLPELPLHPEYQTILPLDLDLEGNEVEFDWCVIIDHDTGKGKEYAKLLDKKEKISDRRSYIAKRLKEEMPKHIADYIDAYAEQIANLEKSIIDEKLSRLTENASFANPILAIHEARKHNTKDRINNKETEDNNNTISNPDRTDNPDPIPVAREKANSMIWKHNNITHAYITVQEIIDELEAMTRFYDQQADYIYPMQHYVDYWKDVRRELEDDRLKEFRFKK